MPSGRARKKPAKPRECQTRANLATPKSKTIRTSVPEVVCALLEIEVGDEVVWSVENESRKVTVRRG